MVTDDDEYLSYYRKFILTHKFESDKLEQFNNFSRRFERDWILNSSKVSFRGFLNGRLYAYNAQIKMMRINVIVDKRAVLFFFSDEGFARFLLEW